MMLVSETADEADLAWKVTMRHNCQIGKMSQIPNLEVPRAKSFYIKQNVQDEGYDSIDSFGKMRVSS